MLEYGGRSPGNRVRKAVSASDYYSAAVRASPAKVALPNHFFRSRGQNHNKSPYPEVLHDQPVASYLHEGYWMDIGRLEDCEAVQKSSDELLRRLLGL